MNENTSKGAVIVGEGVTIKGVISTNGDAVIMGDVEGEVSAREITVGATGRFKGQAVADVAHVHGVVRENLKVNTSLLLGKTGRIFGTVEYAEIEIERGGEIVGTVAQSRTPASKNKNSSEGS